MPAKNNFAKIVNIGITEATPFQLSNKVRVFNHANLVVLLINCLYSIVGIVQQYHIAVTLTVCLVFSGLLCFYLVKHKRYEAAFHFIIISSIIFLTVFSFLFGDVSNVYFYLLFIPVAANILFDRLSVTLIYLFVAIIVLIFNIHLVKNYPSFYPKQEWMYSIGYPNVVFVALLIFVGVRLFKMENIDYSNKIEEQKKSLEEKNNEITDSINYAKRIQSALMPDEDYFKSHFKESFVLFMPKDIVSGDFYWITKKEGKTFFAVGDCTGHGVPGGFMTMLGISFLEEIICGKNIYEPAEVLGVLREKIIHALKQSGNTDHSKDGMDIVLCRLDADSLTYSGANNSLYLIRQGLVTEHKPDKQPCGFHHELKSFTQHKIKTEKDDLIYIFSDGYADQFGGPKGKKFKYKQLESLVLSIHHQPLNEQKNILQKAFAEWKGELEQIDDVCLAAVKIA